jgi:Cytochrome c oxidase assembly protein PET191
MRGLEKNAWSERGCPQYRGVVERNWGGFVTHMCTLFVIYLPRQPAACSEAALSLLTCMEETECVAKDKKGIIECMKDPAVSEDCKAQRNAYYTCKHSQLNMRTRIRGVRVY